MTEEKKDVLEDKVISYHTFMFPFLYEMNKKTTRKKFEDCCHPGWFSDIWSPKAMTDQIWYNQYHYFNEAAHNAIYMTKDFKDTPEAVVRNLRFDLLSLTEKEPKADPEREQKRLRNEKSQIRYVIRKGDDKYFLDINAIRMKLYNTGVGILIFELENRTYLSETDIIKINDFGRRIYAPYYNYTPRKKFKGLRLQEKKVGNNRRPRIYRANRDSMFCTICAESLYLEVIGKGVTQEEASLLPEALRTSADMTVLAEPIRRLLSNEKYQVTTKKECAKHETCIEPVIDDRMFVACYYKNNDFVDAMREWKDDQYCYLTHAKEKYPFDKVSVASRLYTMMYVDGDGICCHSRDMLQKMLSDEHIYTRWLENGWYDEKAEENVFAGTITGISEYAMISVAKNPLPHLINAFLTQYVEIALLALAQRASLLSFEYMISEYARGGKSYDAKKIHDKYILFQSQLLLNEVTPQQQGIELYELLKKNLMIEKQKAEIKEQIEGSFNHANYIHDKKENRMLLVISFLGIVELARTLVDLFGADEANLYWKLGAGVFIAMILLGIYRKK